jgi:large subunit ribosomal protein L14e
MEIGQICIKTKGREAGRRAVVLSSEKNGRVLIDGTKIKRKECNILHLFPLKETIKVGKEAKHEEIVKALEK